MEKQRMILEYLENGSLQFVKDWLNSDIHVTDSLFSLMRSELASKNIKADKPLTWRQKLYLSASEDDKIILREKFQKKESNTNTIWDLRSKLDNSNIEQRVVMIAEICAKMEENVIIENEIKYFEKNKAFLKPIAEDLPADLPKENLLERIKALKRSLEPARILKQNISIETQNKNRVELNNLQEELNKQPL